MDNIRTVKRGHIFCNEGDSITHLLMVKSGRVALFMDRGGKKIEIMTLSSSQVLGEAAAFSDAKHPFSAEAKSDVQFFEVPIEAVRAQVASSPASAKLLIKNLLDVMKHYQITIRSVRMEQEKSPVPQILIPKLFAILNSVARLTAPPIPDNPKGAIVDWGILKIQTSRLFVESPPRMRSFLDLLAKLKLVELKFEKNEEGEEELSKIHVHNVQALEDFGEFYQYNLYKGGKSEVIYIDRLAVRVAKALVELSRDGTIDHRGATRLDYEKLLQDIKSRFQIDLKDTHLNALEKKGLFVKRQATDKQVFLSLDRTEFEKMCFNWDIINEFDIWNEKGFVDLNEKIITPEPTSTVVEMACPSCNGPTTPEHKFCPNCGFKIAA